MQYNSIMKTIRDITSLGITSNSRVLICMPHPDDESVFVSGLLCKLSSAKVPTRVLTFSLGEKSTLRFGLADDADLSKVRTAELKNALKTLGISDFKLLDFGDGNLENQEKEILSYVKNEIGEYKPTLLITLEPNGIYGHPDHVALSKFVSSIPNESFNTLYVTVTPNFIVSKRSSKTTKEIITPTKPEYELKLSIAESIRKLKALKCHKSQFRFDIFHPHSILFFLKNKMLTGEYFASKES